MATGRPRHGVDQLAHGAERKPDAWDDETTRARRALRASRAKHERGARARLMRVGATLFAVTLAAALASTACRGGGAGESSRADQASGAASGTRVALRVSAAVSLTEALQQVATAFEQRTGTRVSLNLAGSNTLATQIVEGAAVDVFISADAAQMDRVARANALLDDTRADILSNRLVIIVPRAPGEADTTSSAPTVPGAASSSSGGAAQQTAATPPSAPAPPTAPPAGPVNVTLSPTLATPRDLLGPDVRRLALGDPAAVPAGVYARQYLERAGVWSALQPKIVPLPHVRAVVTAVATGAADAGIVYQTDIAASREVRIAWTVTAEDAPAIVYPAAVIRGTSHPDAARAFVTFLRSPEAAALFTAAGFTPR